MADNEVNHDAWAGSLDESRAEALPETSRMSITPGMANVMLRGGLARQCSECGLGIPRYRGRYPGTCPTCGGMLETVGEHTEPDADDRGGPPDGDGDEKLGESTLNPLTLFKGQRVKVNAESGYYAGTVDSIGKFSVSVAGDRGSTAMLIQNANDPAIWKLIVGGTMKPQTLGRVTDVVTESINEAEKKWFTTNNALKADIYANTGVKVRVTKMAGHGEKPYAEVYSAGDSSKGHEGGWWTEEEMQKVYAFVAATYKVDHITPFGMLKYVVVYKRNDDANEGKRTTVTEAWLDETGRTLYLPSNAASLLRPIAIKTVRDLLGRKLVFMHDDASSMNYTATFGLEHTEDEDGETVRVPRIEFVVYPDDIDDSDDPVTDGSAHGWDVVVRDVWRREEHGSTHFRRTLYQGIGGTVRDALKNLKRYWQGSLTVEAASGSPVLVSKSDVVKAKAKVIADASKAIGSTVASLEVKRKFHSFYLLARTIDGQYYSSMEDDAPTETDEDAWYVAVADGKTVKWSSPTSWVRESRGPVVAMSLVPRLQNLIEAGTYITDERADPMRSGRRLVPFATVESSVPGGVKGLQLFLEGPIGDSTYFRLEGPMEPVLVFEVNEASQDITIYATETPQTVLGFDPREQLDSMSVSDADEYDATIDAIGESRLDEVGETYPNAEEALSFSPTAGYILSPRPSGATRAHGGFRFRIGANRNRTPKPDLAQAIQNRRNAKRGLASRIRAAKKWHRGVGGDELHKALGRYNRGNHRGEATSDVRDQAEVEAANESLLSELEVMPIDIAYPIFKFLDRSRAVMFAREITTKLGYTPQSLHVPSDGTVTVVDVRTAEKREYYKLLAAAQRYGGSWSGVKDAQGHEVNHFVYGPWNESVSGLEPSAETIDIDLPPSLAMPRAEMPQVEPLTDFIEYVRTQGAVVTKETVAVKLLSGSQDVDPAKVKKMAAQDVDTLRAPIIVSADHFILDGHHSWAALYYLGPLNEIEVYRVGLTFSELLKLAKDWPGATYKQVGEARITEAYSTIMPGIPDRSVDDIFDALLRRLVVIESTDVLEDVEFTDRGSIYLFFDPSLSPAEIEEIMRALQNEEPGLTLIASPNRSLPGETATSDWWVTFLAGKTSEGVEPIDPNMYAREMGAPATARQMVVTKQTSLDAIAASVDTTKSVQAAAAKDSSPKEAAPTKDAAPAPTPTETKA